MCECVCNRASAVIHSCMMQVFVARWSSKCEKRGRYGFHYCSNRKLAQLSSPNSSQATRAMCISCLHFQPPPFHLAWDTSPPKISITSSLSPYFFFLNSTPFSVHKPLILLAICSYINYHIVHKLHHIHHIH